MTPTSMIVFLRYQAALFLSLILMSSGRLQAAPADAAFDAANRAFGSGKYTEAISSYETLLKQNGYSASVLFNLGNAYYRNGQVGLAILNYERALRLDPRDPDIHANLKYARSQSGLPQPSERWWRALLKSLNPSQWAWAASFTFSLLCLLWVVRLVRPEWLQRAGVSTPLLTPIWRLILFLNVVALFLIVACGAMSVQDRHEAIVIVKQASLLVSPFDKSEVMTTLPEGDSVNAEKKYGDYVLVRYEKGKSAWVNQSQIATVEPDLLKTTP